MLRRLTFIVFVFVFACNKQDKQLCITFTGDVLLDRGVRKQIEKYGADFLFENVAPIFHSSDAVIINLECPVTDSVTPINKKYIFRADSKWLPSLRKAGITHAALANNHTIDQGRSGLVATAYFLQKENITPLGYGDNGAASCRPVFISGAGIKLAVFNVVLLPLENWTPLEDKPGICQISAIELAEQVRELKNTDQACYIVAVLHWGQEYRQKPLPAQRRDAYRLINAGVDIIVGHHPHVVQEPEIYKNKPIFYSLGNFIFDSRRPEANKSILLQLFFDKRNVSYRVKKIEIHGCRAEVVRHVFHSRHNQQIENPS
jgi:poly-gamma-glutamate synthesis protein (capsule biosynthesis protein)